jgi:hypothetical protein
MGTFSDKNLLKLVYFIIKSSCYNLQIEDFLMNNECRTADRSSENLKSAAALKRVQW